MTWLNKLLHLGYGMTDGGALNTQSSTSGRTAPHPQALQSLIPALRKAAARRTDGALDYQRMGNSLAYSSYRRFAANLPKFDLRLLDNRRRKLAFWINLYNGLIVDAVIRWRVRKSVQEIPGFFRRARYNVGGQLWSANDIENGVLRANSPHPALPFRPFAAHDPRRQFMLDSIDPRLHFALVCASRSCPPFAAYDESRLDDQLTAAATSFIGGGGVELDLAQGMVRLSRIFQWYAGDFGAGWLGLGDKRPLLDYVQQYLPESQRGLLSSRRDWRVSFKSYDWSLNGIHVT